MHKAGGAGELTRFPKVNTTVHCSICSVARSTDISVFYGYLGLFQEYGRIPNNIIILHFTDFYYAITARVRGASG